MTQEELKDKMVSCYDNGDAMLECVEEYLLQFLCRGCIANLQLTNVNNKQKYTKCIKSNLKCFTENCT